MALLAQKFRRVLTVGKVLVVFLASTPFFFSSPRYVLYSASSGVVCFSKVHCRQDQVECHEHGGPRQWANPESKERIIGPFRE
jgi:hypothetical protein